MMLDASGLAAVEQRVVAALASGQLHRLDVLGFGEVSTVLGARGASGNVACKRMLPFRDEVSARKAARVVSGYVRALRGRGVDVIDTEVSVVPNAEGYFVVYCVQPALPERALAPTYVSGLDMDAAVAACLRVLTKVKEVVSATLAPDGQLSNWAFVDDAPSDRGEAKRGRLLYLDVTTPFWRDDRRRERFDFAHVLTALPTVLRAPVRRFALERTLDTYFTLRGQALDFLGNLQKERLGHLTAALLPLANEVLALDPPISARTVQRYYARDARRYAGLQAAARMRCWFQVHVMNRPYPFVPKPRIHRYS